MLRFFFLFQQYLWICPSLLSSSKYCLISFSLYPSSSTCCFVFHWLVMPINFSASIPPPQNAFLSSPLVMHLKLNKISKDWDCCCWDVKCSLCRSYFTYFLILLKFLGRRTSLYLCERHYIYVNVTAQIAFFCVSSIALVLLFLFGFLLFFYIKFLFFSQFCKGRQRKFALA